MVRAVIFGTLISTKNNATVPFVMYLVVIGDWPIGHLIMRYFYGICIDKIEDATIDELYIMMSKQARISTRRKLFMFNIMLSGDTITVNFDYKRDRDDFESTFEKTNREFLEKHGFIEATPSTPRFDWSGYTDRLMNPPHRR